jgi:hypothetical protein
MHTDKCKISFISIILIKELDSKALKLGEKNSQCFFPSKSKGSLTMKEIEKDLENWSKCTTTCEQ